MCQYNCQEPYITKQKKIVWKYGVYSPDKKNYIPPFMPGDLKLGIKHTAKQYNRIHPKKFKNLINLEGHFYDGGFHCFQDKHDAEKRTRYCNTLYKVVIPKGTWVCEGECQMERTIVAEKVIIKAYDPNPRLKGCLEKMKKTLTKGI